ncbi:unnamed protein product [Cylicocyclus nassatus]|uniref:Uncharacterized protein n=1 Tax=Cylicocyclus nassatus TaxID=53992 RepID=A0AA36M2U9_CYLNA|nr:unnamed protein product [Cylicocyclus nassatus]
MEIAAMPLDILFAPLIPCLLITVILLWETFRPREENCEVMTSHNIQALQNVLLALETMEEMMDYEESVSKARAYVREEHVPFLESRFRNLDSYIASHNPDNFAHFTRLFLSEFQDLHERLGPYLQHEPFHVAPISAQRRLFVYLSRRAQHRKADLSDIVSEVTDAVNTVLFADAFPTPIRQALEDCAMKTQQRYDYPRAVDFMDGKHVGLRVRYHSSDSFRTYIDDRSYFKKPKNAGSTYWNYKGFHSIILLAVCDCGYRFTAIDIVHQDELETRECSGIRTSRRSTKFGMTYSRKQKSSTMLDQCSTTFWSTVVSRRATDTSDRFRNQWRQQLANVAMRDSAGQGGSSNHHSEYFARGSPFCNEIYKSNQKRALKLITSLLVLHNLLARRQDLLEGVERFAPARNSPLPDRFASLQRTARHAGSDSAKIARDRLVSYYDNLYRTPQ